MGRSKRGVAKGAWVWYPNIESQSLNKPPNQTISASSMATSCYAVLFVVLFVVDVVVMVRLFLLLSLHSNNS